MKFENLRNRLSSEAGFTMIEVLAASVLLVIGAFAVIASFDQSRGLASQSESQVAASIVAERQLDAGLALPFSKLALNATTPSSGGSTLDKQWNNVLMYGTESAGATTSPIVPTPSPSNNCSTVLATSGFTGYNEAIANDETTCIVSCPTASGDACPNTGASGTTTSGVVIPYSVVSDARGARYEVYRYVTWVNDIPCGLLCPNPGLPTATLVAGTNPWLGDYKRLTIAVQVLSRATGTGATAPFEGLKKPVVVSAVKVDPSRGTANVGGGTSALSQPGVIG